MTGMEILVFGTLSVILMVGLRLLRSPLTWLVLGVLNLLAGAVNPALICFGVGAVVFVLTSNSSRQKARQAPLT
jgi:phosphoglycerol transferase MdoB-like AlkP superfamily enzyme